MNIAEKILYHRFVLGQQFWIAGRTDKFNIVGNHVIKYSWIK